ncbi:response regulator transcription factor [Actinomyces naeslundii]|jgi:regulatory protein, luxR:response regulator receiver|uniref:response regulator transcription factor n=1 Tax=Actinomyces naeslundii TaxID=1655 RepID=UPI00096F6D6E|nr:response regulator transcription factor [Actinomyces naeslundii]OMG07219.1 DNA-binding response regulator [Actinomyces naeslundii]OMG14985.1 DNA-binding response regulator [Actinomyces naeslundii]OMG31735.1 DNA-binding response regulator [Actinomyces naeslundii]PKY94649.1 DNA-binding response regulator [Actinomyces naeslundii]
MHVLVVDDNPIVRVGLVTLLRRIEQVDSVGEAGDGVEAIEEARKNTPDVVLLDVDMPRMSGLDALPELSSNSAVLMLTNSSESTMILRALDLGAKGYLVHGGIGIKELAGALVTALMGGMVLGPEAAEVVVNGPEQETVNPLRSKVTEREAEVLDAAARGMTNEEIAREQFLSARTVKNYLNAAYPKLGVHNRAEAVLVWVNGGAN